MFHNIYKSAILLFILTEIDLQSMEDCFQFVDNKSEGSLSSQFLEKLIAAFQPDVFFETGTYDGNTTLNASNYFNQVFTVEIYKPLFNAVQPKFQSHPNIHSILGNSSEAIINIGKTIQGTILFWLDAHYSGEGTGLLESANSGSAEAITAIREELAAISEIGISDCVILIDDIRSFGTEITGQLFLGCWAYPTLQEVQIALAKINSCFEVALLGDTLLAYDGSKYRPNFSDTVKACTKTRLYDGYNLSNEELTNQERTIQIAPPHEAAFIAKLYEMMTCYADPMFWHDFWYGLIQLEAKNFAQAREAFQKVPLRIQSGTFKTEKVGRSVYEHKSLHQYIESCTSN